MTSLLLAVIASVVLGGALGLLLAFWTDGKRAASLRFAAVGCVALFAVACVAASCIGLPVGPVAIGIGLASLCLAYSVAPLIVLVSERSNWGHME